MNPVPPLPASMSAVTKFAAHATHFLLYVLIIAIPLSGWLLVSSSPLGLPTMYFGWFAWPELPYFSDLPRAAKKLWVQDFATVHIYLAWSAIVLVTIHVVAALYHQFIRRDVVLGRMLPLARGAEKA
jgi:cytochrome b561